MSGETNLEKLLASMSPSMMPDEVVFISIQGDYGVGAELKPIAAVIEDEGLTLVVAKKIADQNQLAYDSAFRGITLLVHSSLQAVGLTAAFSNALAGADISANVIAGFYHDHIFVPTADADSALAALQALAESAKGS